MNKIDNSNIILFGMDNCKVLAEEISKILNIRLTPIVKTTYQDGETMLVSEDTVRNRDVYIIASTSKNVNHSYMELFLFLDSLKRASAKNVTVALTYYGYARQDRKVSGRQPIGAKLMANLLQKAGADRIISIDLHNPSIQGFFDIPVDDLKAQYPLALELKKTYSNNFTIVSPDHGGTVRARKFAELISDNLKICIIDKRRTGANQSEVMGILGEIKNQNAVIVDDIIDTGGTILKAAKALKNEGAKDVILVASHGLFTKGFEIFENDENIKEVLITNSVDNYENLSKFKKLKIVSLASFLSEVISASVVGESISEIYKKWKEAITLFNNGIQK